MNSSKLPSFSPSINEDNETGSATLEPPSDDQPPDLPGGKKPINGSKFTELKMSFRKRYYPDITDEQWNSWSWQFHHSITRFDQLEKYFTLTADELKRANGEKKLPVRITPYYAGLIDPNNPEQPIRRTMIPVYNELITTPEEESDPLGEENQSPVPQLIHRYPDRVLFLTTGVCAAYCRYCTRSHMVSKTDKVPTGYQVWDRAIEYIRNHPEVRDVILSGGDPLTLSDEKLEYLLSSIRAIPHVEMIRIGTKVPVVMPQRITPELVGMFRKYHPLFMSIHFTHPDEITPEVKVACTRLADAGIPLGSQTVLLKGINDQVETMKSLMHKLLMIRVRPYYIYQCDPIPGSSHFRTPVAKGLEIIKGLRGHTSGYAIPHLVIDSPGGGGKIPILPNYIAEKNEDGYLLNNYQGRQFLYRE